MPLNSYSSGDGPHEQSRTSADRILSRWFCFVQTEDGKVVKAYYPREELPEIVNFKKSIAAAFQANFKGTEEEEEVDPQSKHKAHYQ